MKNGRGKREEGWGKVLLLALLISHLSSLISLPVVLAAEKAQPVQATAKVLKNKIKLGDEIRLLIQVEHPRKYTVIPLDEKIDVRPFEVKHMDSSPVLRGQNRVQETFGYTLTVFELGELKIPAVKVRFRDGSGELDDVSTEPVLVTVSGVLKKLTDKDDIRAIKGPVSIGFSRFRDWILGILAGLLFIILIVKIIRRWLKNRQDPESKRPPHERVKIELGRLKDQGYLQDKLYKEYFTGLSDILRRYVERSMSVDALECTTAELMEKMKQKNVEAAVTEKVRNVLETTDLVKFAKHHPERSQADTLEAEILEIVDMTRPAEGPKK